MALLFGGHVVFSAGGSGVDLGSAYARIRIDLNELQSDMRSAQGIFARGLQTIGPSIQNVGQGISRLGQELTIATAPITAFGATGIRAAGDFELLLKQIEVFGGVAGDQLRQVKEYALDMGAQTKFSASDAATGLLDLLKSGQSLEEAMGSLRGILDLAAAGELSLASASGVVTSALAQFRLGADQSGRVATSLVQAANASRAEVSDLGAALENVGPIAAQFGLSIEDVSAVLAVFSQSGITGAEAGTQLRSMLLNMSETTATTQAAWDALGISLYDTNGNVRDFNTVLVELDDRMSQLPVERQNELMRALGGAYGVLGLSALRSAGGIDTMRQAMGQSADASEVAGAFTDSFKGSVESLQGSLETLQIEAFGPFLDRILTPFIKSLTEVINRVTGWVRANPALTQSILRFATALVAMGPILTYVGKVIALIGSLLTPQGLIIGGLTLLYSAFETNFLGIRDILEPFVDTFVNGFRGVIGAIGNFQSNLEEGGISRAIGSILANIGQMFGLIAPDSMGGMEEFVDDIYDLFMRISNTIQNHVLPTLQSFADWFLHDALPAVANFVTGTVVPAIGGFFEWLGGVWEAISPSLSRLFNWLRYDILPVLVSFVQDTVIPVVGRFIGILEGIWRTISPVLGNLVNWFVTDGLDGIIEFLEGDATTAFNNVIGIIKDLWDKTSPKLEELRKWIVDEAGPKIKNFLENEFAPAVQDVATKFRAWYLDVKPDLERFQNLVTTVLNQLLWTGVDPLKKALVALPWETQQSIAQAMLSILDFIKQLEDIMQSGSLGEVIIRGLLRGYVTEDETGQNKNAGKVYRDMGGPGLAGSLYMLRTPATPEAYFVPPADGQFYPNFDQMLANAGSTNNGIILENPVFEIHANGAREGREAADAFAERIQERFRERA